MKRIYNAPIQELNTYFLRDRRDAKRGNEKKLIKKAIKVFLTALTFAHIVLPPLPGVAPPGRAHPLGGGWGERY